MKSLSMAALVVGCTLAAQLAVAATPEIALTFVWPANLEAQVDFQRTRARSTAGKAPRAQEVAMQYRMKASKPQDLQDGSALISFDQVAIHPKTLPAGISAEQRAAVELAMRAMLPSYVVNAKGSFTGIHDLPAFRQSLRNLIGSVLGERAAAPAAQQALERATSDAVLTAAAESEWERVVSSWAGERLELGKTYSGSGPAPLPMMPSETVQMASTYRIVRTLPCTRAGGTRECVEIELETRPEPGAMAKAIETFVRSLAASGQPVAFRITALDVRHTLTLVTEPESLVPHEYRATKRTTVRARSGGEAEEETMTENEETLVRYRYATP